jgi:transcriptional regulator with XRE-family HTH domain
MAYNALAMTAEEIKERLARRGMTVKELAVEAQTSYTTLSMVLNGHRPLTTRMEQRLLAALERSTQSGLQFTLTPETAAKLQALADAKGITAQEAAEELLSILLNLPGSK